MIDCENKKSAWGNVKSFFNTNSKYIGKIWNVVNPVLVTCGVNATLSYVNKKAINFIINNALCPMFCRWWIIQKILYGAIGAAEEYGYWKIKQFCAEKCNLKFNSKLYDGIDSVISVVCTVMRVYNFQPNNVITLKEYFFSWENLWYDYWISFLNIISGNVENISRTKIINPQDDSNDNGSLLTKFNDKYEEQTQYNSQVEVTYNIPCRRKK